MGKQFTVKSGFYRVFLSDGKAYDAGQSGVLSDANVTRLTSGMQRAITLGSTVADPTLPGATSLGSLADVLLGTLGDGKVLTYDQASGKWVARVVAGDGVGAEIDDTSTTSTSKTWSVAKMMSTLMSKIGNVYSLTNPTTQRVFDITIEDDGSATSGWIDRLRFQFKTGGVTRPVSWFNEYGEFRGVSAKSNTVSSRRFTRYNSTDAPHDAATPVDEVVDSRDVRTNRHAIYADGSTIQSGRSRIVTDAGVTMEMAWMRLAVGASLPANMPTYPVLIVRT